MKIRHLTMVLASILALGINLGTGAQAAPKENWIGAWGFVPLPQPPGTVATAPISATPPLSPTAGQPPSPPVPLLIDNPGNVPVELNLDSDPSNVTVRQLVRVSCAGARIRLRFSNEGGSDVLVLGAVHVGIAGPDGSVMPGTDRVVTFNGKGVVAIPASAPLLSDAVDLKVDALQKLVITSYVPGALLRGSGATTPQGGHALYQYVAGTPGNQTAAAQLPAQRIMRLTALVTLVEVDAPQMSGTIVAFGDSITEGATSTNNAFRGWPDRLAEKLAAAKSKYAVANAGIGGNRLLRYGTGTSALARLDRDVFSVPGVKYVILLEGINDIGRGFTTQGPQEAVSLDALIAADRQIIERCHERGIKVIGA